MSTMIEIIIISKKKLRTDLRSKEKKFHTWESRQGQFLVYYCIPNLLRKTQIKMIK